MRGEDCPTGRAKTCWRFFFLYAMYCLVLMLSSFLVCTHIGEMGKDERRDNVHFSSFWFTIDFLLSYQNIDGVYWVWGRLIFQRAQAPVVNYLKANVPQAPLHSRIWTCKLNNRVGVSIWFSPLHLYVSMKALLVVIRVQPCIGVSMKAQFVVIRVQPCFDLGLLGTLGQVWVSLGTSQVHSIWFVWV